MSLLPVEPAWRLAERAEEHRWLVTGLWSEQARAPRAIAASLYWFRDG
jgi:hypothetical protein